jgi:predicted dehydrogenase
MNYNLRFNMLTDVVVVEKPFTITTAEADHIIAVAKETGKLLTCFQSL